MKHLLIIFLLLSATASCQTLNKIVNGVTVPLTKQEADALKAEWQAAKEAYSADSALQVQLEAEDLIIFQFIRNYLQLNVVGKKLEDLTVQNKDYILAALLYRAGGVDKDRRVNPLNEWLKK